MVAIVVGVKPHKIATGGFTPPVAFKGAMGYKTHDPFFIHLIF
ncbi:MAG: hypothetical protein N2596_03060 [Syntrophorhabdaceae bacterium]|nr:hypothetical protein [Syntrophorhabdaceae bacterium]